MLNLRSLWRERFGLQKAHALLISLCCVAAYMSVGSAAFAKPIAAETGYEIVNMIVTPSMHWIDDDRLLFIGMKRAEVDAAATSKDRSRLAQLRKIYIWDANTASAKYYADGQTLCFADNFVSYKVGEDKDANVHSFREGLLGQETEKVYQLKSRDAVRSNLTCRFHLQSQLTPPAAWNHHVVVLRNGDGYLHLAPELARRQAFPRNLTLYQGKSGEPIALPMTWEEDFAPTAVAYSVLRGAYVLHPRMPRGSRPGQGKPWPKDLPLRTYLLWADGRSEAIEIPYWPAQYLVDPRPISGGWVFGGGKILENAGLYKFAEKKVVRIDSGLVREIAVAPSGCRLASGIKHSPYDISSPVSVKVYDVCDGKE